MTSSFCAGNRSPYRAQDYWALVQFLRERGCRRRGRTVGVIVDEQQDGEEDSARYRGADQGTAPVHPLRLPDRGRARWRKRRLQIARRRSPRIFAGRSGPRRFDASDGQQTRYKHCNPAARHVTDSPHARTQSKGSVDCRHAASGLVISASRLSSRLLRGRYRCRRSAAH